MTAPTPAGLSPHSTSSVTAAVVSAKSRSRAGLLQLLAPEEDVAEAQLRLRSAGVGRAASPAAISFVRVAGADLGLQLRELVVDLARRGDLRELAVELRPVVA